VKRHFAVIAAVILSVGNVAGQQPQQSTPVSVGIVLDTSGSMAFNLARARQLVTELLKAANAQDEFTFIQSSDRPVALSGFVSAGDAMQTLAFTQSKGRSALLDGIYLASQLTKMARNQRRVLLVISDGEDNASRYTETEVGNALSQAGVFVFTVGMDGPKPNPDLLIRFAERTRGLYLAPTDASQWPKAALELSAATRR